MARRDPHSYTDLDQGEVTHLNLDVLVDFEHHCLAGTATLTLKSPVSGPIDLDTRDLTIDRIATADDQEVAWTLAPTESFMGAKLTVELPPGTDRFSIHYRTAREASALQWLEPAQTAGKTHPYLFSQCQPIHARSMVPIQDSPRVRFGYDARITVPAPLTAVMSAAPGDRRAAPKPDQAVFQFSMPQPIPAYLLALAVGNLEARELGPRSRVYAEPEMIESAAWEFADVDKMLLAAEELFSPYRWERFDFLVMPPSFPYGGMENPRLTFLTPTLLAGDRSLVNVLAHELAHSWTGNLVTNATMNDFWLNEGFTVWAERRILERLADEEAVALASAIGYNGLLGEIERFGEDSPLTHLKTDLSGQDPDEVYSVVPYEKGYLFVALLEQTVGRERFAQFIRDYIERFGFTSITTEEFEAFVEQNLPGTLQKVGAEQWIRAPGIPSNSPRFESSALNQTQTLAADWSTGARPEAAVAQKWSPELWQIYLQGLPKQIAVEDCALLDETFHLSGSKNAEILSCWLKIAAASAYEPTFDRIDKFLGSMGRMKFVKPLFKTLQGGATTQALARRIFAKYADSYHPIARKGLEQILGL